MGVIPLVQPADAQCWQVVSPLGLEISLRGALIGPRRTILRPLIQRRAQRFRKGEGQLRRRQSVSRHSIHWPRRANPAAELELGPAERIFLAQDLDLRADQLEDKLKGVGGYCCPR